VSGFKENIMLLIRSAALLLVVLTVLTGLAYPALITVIASAAFPSQARGSLIKERGEVLGSTFIAQPFDDARYFWGRPSTTSGFPNNAAASTGSNQGPLHPALHDAVAARIAALRAVDPGNRAPVPIDLVTASGSGLDPHISPAAAYFQVARVARVRGLSDGAVRALVDRYVEGRTFGLLGERRVNVLLLNLALDHKSSRR
jgi:K+-transporting ATPase ATPase C chain